MDKAAPGKKKLVAAAVFLWAALLVLNNCKKKSGDSTPLPEPAAPSQATLTWIQANIFNGAAGCAVAACHGGAQVPTLSSRSESFTNLVSKPSAQNPSVNYVEPGDSSASYLVTKSISAGISGSRMPQNNLTFFDTQTDQLQAIRDWIDDGAQDN